MVYVYIGCLFHGCFQNKLSLFFSQNFAIESHDNYVHLTCYIRHLVWNIDLLLIISCYIKAISCWSFFIAYISRDILNSWKKNSMVKFLVLNILINGYINIAKYSCGSDACTVLILKAYQIRPIVEFCVAK